MTGSPRRNILAFLNLQSKPRFPVSRVESFNKVSDNVSGCLYFRVGSYAPVTPSRSFVVLYFALTRTCYRESLKETALGNSDAEGLQVHTWNNNWEGLVQLYVLHLYGEQFWFDYRPSHRLTCLKCSWFSSVPPDKCGVSNSNNIWQLLSSSYPFHLPCYYSTKLLHNSPAFTLFMSHIYLTDTEFGSLYKSNPVCPFI